IFWQRNRGVQILADSRTVPEEPRRVTIAYSATHPTCQAPHNPDGSVVAWSASHARLSGVRLTGGPTGVNVGCFDPDGTPCSGTGPNNELTDVELFDTDRAIP